MFYVRSSAIGIDCSEPWTGKSREKYISYCPSSSGQYQVARVTTANLVWRWSVLLVHREVNMVGFFDDEEIYDWTFWFSRSCLVVAYCNRACAVQMYKALSVRCQRCTKKKKNKKKITLRCMYYIPLYRNTQHYATLNYSVKTSLRAGGT